MGSSSVKTPEELERILNELPKKPFLVGEEGVSMSLAGVQTKIGVHVDEGGRICIPVDGSPSTWILKPDSPSLWGGVYNEAFCLALARHAEISAPDSLRAEGMDLYYPTKILHRKFGISGHLVRTLIVDAIRTSRPDSGWAAQFLLGHGTREMQEEYRTDFREVAAIRKYHATLEEIRARTGIGAR